MRFADRRNSEAAIAEQLADAEQRLKTEREARLGWVTIQPFYKPTMEESLNFGKQELNRLNNAISQPPADAGKAYRDAFQKIKSAADEKARTAAVSEARTAGVPDKYLATLQAAANR
jgi:hypothetical protein